MKKLYSILFSLTISVVALSQNLVPNGNFESWTGEVPDNYVLLQSSGRTDIQYNKGTGLGKTGDALKITALANGSSADGSFETTITGIIPGKIYELSVWAKSADDKLLIRFWDTRFLDGSDGVLAPELDESTYNAVTSDVWTKYGPFTLTAPTGAAKLRINFRVYVQTGFVASTSAILVDDLTLIDVSPNVDATLSDLKVDGVTISGFNSATFDYLKKLASGTSTVPTVTATSSDPLATVLITPATDLNGDKAARTTTIRVTGTDGTTSKSYTILFNPLIELSSLMGLRSATELDRDYKVLGEVVLTAQMTYRNKKYIQDGTAGILIDDNAGVITTTYNVGDGITGIIGTLELYNGMLQWHPTADPGLRSSENNAIVPQVITVNEFKTNFEMYESEVVKIMDLGFRAADAGVNFTNGKNYTVGNTGDSTILRTDFYDIFTGTVVPVAANVTGIALEFNGTAQLAPRVVSDIAGVGSAIDSRELQKLKIYPVPASSQVTLEGIESFSSVEVMDITGKRVVNFVNDGNPMQTISVENLPRGIYFVKFNSTAGSVTRKIVKK